MSSAARQKAGSNPAAAPVWSAGPAGSGEGGRAAPSGWLAVKLQTMVREDFTIMKKAPTMAFSWLKVAKLVLKAIPFEKCVGVSISH